MIEKLTKVTENFAYGLGVFKRIWDIVSLPICVFILFLFVIRYKPQQTTYVIPPVVVINKDGSSIRLLNDNSDEAYRSAAINTAQRIAGVIFGYSNDGEYAARAAEVSKTLQENSKAAHLYRDTVQRNLNEAKKNTATFTPDSEGIIAQLDPNNRGIMVVILHGFQSISTVAGTTSNKVTISYSMYFNEKRGDDGEVFKVSEFNLNN